MQAQEDELIHSAIEGEYVASRVYHADNIAPAIIDEIIFIRG